MIPDPLLETAGAVDSLTLEKAVFDKRPFGWKEGPRRFIARYSWDSSGRLVSEEREAETHLYAYDDRGRKIARYSLDPEGGVTGREMWEWDGEDRMVRRVLRSLDPPAEEEWTYEHDDAGRLTAERRGRRVRVEKRDADGRLVREYLYDGERADLITDFEYGGEGLTTSVTIRAPEGSVQRREDYEWEDGRRLAALRVVDSEGRPVLDESYAYGAVHGERWLERVTWVPDGKSRGKRRPSEVVYRSFTFGTPENRAARGTIGTMAYANGVYHGPLLGDRPEGTGRFQYNDDSLYEGEFREGVMEGAGRLAWPDGRMMEGTFGGGLLEGEGSCVWKDGSRYDGRFVNGRMHGPGVFTWADGSRFHGLFENGRRTDQGAWEKPGDGSAELTKAVGKDG